MKKFCLLLIVFSLFLCSGCELLSQLLLGDEPAEQKEVDVSTDSSAEIYLVKLNNSSKTVNVQQTGYVSSVESARFSNETEYTDTDSFIRNLNRQLNEKVSESYALEAARSSTSDRAITQGYNTTISYKAGDTKKFWSYVKTEKTITGKEKNISGQVSAVCKYAGNHCYVFADSKNEQLTDKGINLSNSDYKTIGQKFDSCYELETSVNGSPFYEKYNSTYFIPCNKKIIILVSDLFGDASDKQDSGTVGYFYQGDMYNQDYLDRNQGFFSDEINSNECEIFYIDALFLTKRPETVYSTLVHEFNHMINYVIKTVNYMTNNPSAKSFRTCDTWFTEMLSMTTEDMFQNYLGIKDVDSPKGRLPYFNMYYNYGFKSWENEEIPSLIMYANTYAFGAFLARNFGGADLIKKIAQNDYVNEEAITAALREQYPDYKYVDEFTKQTRKIDFDYAVRKFSMCLFNTDKPTKEQLQKTGDDQYFSFYRSSGNQTGAGLGFTPIDIMNIECDYEQKDGTIKHDIIQPVIYEKTTGVNIYPSGFTVHYVGKNIKSFHLIMNPKLEYYLITVFSL